MRAVSVDCPNVLDTKILILKRCIQSLILIFDSLEWMVIVKHASVISKEEENGLWDNGILGDDTPLSSSVFYYNGKNLCL